MPTKYVGRTTAWQGKRIWEILCNLKDFGKGRLLTKGMWEFKYPNEISYIKVLKAEPIMDQENKFGAVWCKQVFRNQHDGERLMRKGVYSPDWKLIHKEDEHKYLEAPKVIREEKIFPRQTRPPPAMEESFRLEKLQEGISISGPIYIDMCLSGEGKSKTNYRRAKETETPNVTIEKPHKASPHRLFYDHLDSYEAPLQDRSET
ncbi:unnamed protein product [Darwinula stevensoni]|uniref:Uncharacterized protein n=1 Tax=Darwinula stevensoni TaxID=69355 RepID=A0A7R9FPI8_9CRUS|nr:unnamed protein product [Darwinula stevensoni]CAG0897651.1 unnamed protein product [Darwinula stevensoni]